MLADGFEYGYAAHQEVEWCIRREGAWNMLCGRRRGFVPVLMAPANPDPVHAECAALYEALTRPVEPVATEPVGESGVCPACGTVQPVDGGRVQAHGGCPGVNMRPRAGGS